MNKIVIAALCGLVLSAPAQARRPNYSLFEVAHVNSKDDATGESDDGVRFAIGASLTRMVYFTAAHDHIDLFGGNANLSSAGFGVHTQKSTWQLFGAGSYERIAVSGDAGGEDREEGFGVQLGGRLPWDIYELQLDYKYVNFGDDADGNRIDEDRYRLSALAHLGKTLALTASYAMFEQAEDVKQWTVGLRFNFRNRHDLPLKRAGGPTPPPPPPAEEESVE